MYSTTRAKLHEAVCTLDSDAGDTTLALCLHRVHIILALMVERDVPAPLWPELHALKTRLEKGDFDLDEMQRTVELTHHAHIAVSRYEERIGAR